MNKTFNIKKADTTVPAFVISFHKVVAKDSYNSYFFFSIQYSVDELTRRFALSVDCCQFSVDELTRRDVLLL